MQETQLLEALLQCNNYTQRADAFRFNKDNDREREKKLFRKVIQRSSSLMRPSPSCPLEKPLSSSVEGIGEVLAYTAERERLVSSPYLRASSVDGGNELLDWGMRRSVPGRQVVQQLWRITHSGKL